MAVGYGVEVKPYPYPSTEVYLAQVASVDVKKQTVRLQYTLNSNSSNGEHEYDDMPYESKVGPTL